MAIAPSSGYRTRLTGLVTCYGRRVGDPRAPASNFSSHLMSLKVVSLSPSLLPLPLGGEEDRQRRSEEGKSRVSELNPPPYPSPTRGEGRARGSGGVRDVQPQLLGGLDPLRRDLLLRDLRGLGPRHVGELAPDPCLIVRMDLSEVGKLPLDDLFRHAPHRFRDIEIEPRLLACVEQIEQRRDLAIIVVAVAMIVARRIA